MQKDHWLERYKPAATARAHLLAAASLWTFVGLLLAYIGVWSALGGNPILVAVILVCAAAAGVGKAVYVLHRTADRAIERIRTRGDGRCLGGFFSWKTWLFVLMMIGLGRVLRMGFLPPVVVGLIYTAVGVALLVASRAFWVAWYRNGRGATSARL